MGHFGVLEQKEPKIAKISENQNCPVSFLQIDIEGVRLYPDMFNLYCICLESCKSSQKSYMQKVHTGIGLYNPMGIINIYQPFIGISAVL